MKRKLYKLFLLLMITALYVNAQTEGYRFTAAVKAVDSSGFYNIVLTPQINAHVKTGYSDLRIVNDSGKWVSHLVRFPYGEVSNDPVVWERKILRKFTSVWQTEIVVESDQTNISNLVFTLKNAVTNRYCNLSGSDDGESWFTINDSISIVTTQKNVANESDFELLFPPVDYKYFKIIIKNWGRESLNIIRAGTKGIIDYPGRIKSIQEIQNPVGTLVQKDSGNISYIRVEQPAAYHFEKIALQLRDNGVKNYNSKAALYIPASGVHSFANPGLLVSSFNVSNNSTLQTKFAESKAGTFYVLIYNEDNLPLQIAEVKTFIKYRVATVYLNRAENYRLMLDNATALLPAYDLNLNSIPFKEKIPTVAVSNISATNSGMPGTAPKNNTTQLIWFAIAVAAIVLGFFTYRLVTDMNKKNTDI